MGSLFIITSVVLIILLTAVPLSLAVQKQKPSQPDQPILVLVVQIISTAGLSNYICGGRIILDI